MLYYLFNYLQEFNIPGVGMFQYITFRSALAIITSLIISMLYGKKIIRYLQIKQIGETVRDLGLDGQLSKKGTPTMGGLVIIGAILIPTLLFARLENIYVILMLTTTIWLGAIGFLDDYIKIFRKHKEGLAGKFKLLGQISLGLIVGLVMWLHPEVMIREDTLKPGTNIEQVQKLPVEVRADNVHDTKATRTNIPFFKDNDGDYSTVFKLFFDNETARKWGWGFFIIVAIFIIAAVSNGANMTDGLDGLATGTSAIIGVTLGVLAYLSGNLIYSDYLNIYYIPFTGELVVFMSAFIGATIGFLWYNSYPAQVFMGDTGSLTIGGIIAVFAILIRKELLIPILCGIFLIENISVIMQVSWFKYTRKKFGIGRRIFRMAPLHHHYQKSGMPEAKIVTRFWIIGLLLAVITILTLKIR